MEIVYAYKPKTGFMNNKSNSTGTLIMLKEVALGLFGFFGGYYSTTNSISYLILGIISGASYFTLGIILYMKSKNNSNE